MTDLVIQMQSTLDLEERKGMARQVTAILAGVDPEHGLAGIQAVWGVMNGLQRTVAWNYAHVPDDPKGRRVWQFAHAAHHWDRIWMDSNHPDFPA